MAAVNRYVLVATAAIVLVFTLLFFCICAVLYLASVSELRSFIYGMAAGLLIIPMARAVYRTTRTAVEEIREEIRWIRMMKEAERRS